MMFYNGSKYDYGENMTKPQEKHRKIVPIFSTN